MGHGKVMHPAHQHFLVIRTVEDADVAPLGQAAVDPPEIIVVQLLRRGLLEGVYLHALRVEAAHHVLDGAVLPRGIHGLKDQQQRLPVLSVKAVLQTGHALHVFLQQAAALRLALYPAGIRWVAFFNGEAAFFRITIGGNIHAVTIPFL